MKRIYLLIILCTLNACSDKNDTEDAGPVKQELHISIGASPQSLDPHVVTGIPEMKILAAIGEPLVRLNPETFAVEPAAAANWHISKDGKVYTFHLRKNAHWSDGSPVTANDFVFSWQRAMLPSVGWQYATDYYKIKGAKTYHQSHAPDPQNLGVIALDDYTLQFQLNSASTTFLKQLSVEIQVPINKAALLSHGAIDDINSDWTLAGNYLSNGPFTLKKWEVNKILVAEKNPYYWDADNVRLQKIYFYPIETESAEERAFRSGQIQVAFGGRVPVAKIAKYLKQRPNEIKITNAYGIYSYYINVNKPPFDDVRVRAALSHAIDRDSITKNITKAGEHPATTLTPPTPNYSNLVTGIHYDLHKAKQLLAEAGYPNGEGFPNVSLLYNTSDNHRQVALAIQQMWKTQLGINVSLENQEWKVFLNTRQNQSYDIARAGSISGIGDPLDFLESYKTGHGMNDTGWSNHEFDEIVHLASTELDENARNQLMAKAEDILLNDFPVIPIYYYVYSYLVADEVKGLSINSLSLIDYRTIYIEAAEQ